jgi:hypothetical protein
MIHEIRTYNLKHKMVPEYRKRFGEKLPDRAKLSPLGGHWATEVGNPNEVVAIWPYDSLEHRKQVRAEADASGIWPPDTGDLIESMVSEIYTPAPFAPAIGERNIGPIYEMRMYTYSAEDIPEVLESWGERLAARQEYSPMAGCWYKETGGLDNFVHMWAYPNFEERMRIRVETRANGVWPPPNSAPIIRQRTKLLMPAPFSPMQ